MDHPRSWAVLAGIALSPQDPPLDLIPQSVREQQSSQVRRREMVLCGLWGGVAIILAALALGGGYIKNNMALGQLGKQLKEKQAQASRIEKRLKSLKEFEQILSNRMKFPKWMEEIYHMMPKEISLVNLTLNRENHSGGGKTTLSFQGVSVDAASINQMQRSMASSPLFSTVILDYVNKRVTQDGETNYFKITVVTKLDNPDEKSK